MKFSILIISFKSLSILRKCLINLGDTRDILIIENSNSLDVKNHILKEFPYVKFILNNKNLGFAKAANIGLNSINSDNVMMINTDVVIKEDQVTNLENEIFNSKIEYALATPYADDLVDFIAKSKFDKLLNNHDLLDNNEKFQKVDFIKGSILIINLKKFTDKNLFDENFFFFFEEIDLCRKVKILKQTIYVLMFEKVVHFGSGSTSIKHQNYVNFRNWNYIWSSFYYNKKHYGFLFSFFKHLSKLFRYLIGILFFFFLSKNKFLANKFRFLGLLSSMLGIKSIKSSKFLD